MSTDTLRPIVATVSIVALALSAASVAAAQSRSGGRRITPDPPFTRIWVVDRTMSEPIVWRALVDVTAPNRFVPVILHAGDDERWTASLVHLLELLPEGDVVWVSDRGTVFDVDDVVSPAALEPDRAGRLVYSSDERVDDVAALIAMRIGAGLVFELPPDRGPTVLVGVEGSDRSRREDVFLPTRAEALSYADALTDRSVVMIAPAGGLLPEHVLWAYQRGARIIEVEPPPYDLTDAWSEFVAVEEVARQVHTGVERLLGAERPEALVVAGDWFEVPFRYPYGIGAAGSSAGAAGYPGPCSSCDSGRYEFAADLVYANLDGDPWIVPDVPIGRFMSPVRDLLAIQTVLGVWHAHGAYPPAGDGVFLGLLGTELPTRRSAVDAWTSAFEGRVWSVIGPEGVDPGYVLDRDAFFSVADRADIVVVHGHGHPDFVSPNGSPANQSISGTELVRRSTQAAPSFWFLHACGAGKLDLDDPDADETLLVGLQSRLIYGALMAVENTSSASSDPYWWNSVVEPGIPVGELVRRLAASVVAAYRDGSAVGEGLPRTGGSDDNKRFNSRSVLSWIGDPLTPVAANE
jgi:hypothetical protein